MHEAARTPTTSPAFFGSLAVLPAATLLLTDAGKMVRAVELYALASRYPFVVHSRWHNDVVKQTIADAATSLPEDVAKAAQERGRAMSLEKAIAYALGEKTR